MVVTACLEGNHGVLIPRDPSNRRTPAGLKFLATELVCYTAGGPEKVTSRGFDDAKLGVPVEQWADFMKLVRKFGSELWHSDAVVKSLALLIEENQSEFCIGIVSKEVSPEAASRRALMDAGFGHVESTAALERCHGDAIEALALLRSGWSPDYQQPSASASDAPACPFSRNTTNASACPVASASRGAVDTGKIAARVLGNPLQDELDELLLEDPSLICPITMVLTLDAVIASDGVIYEKLAITELKNIRGLSPVTHAPLTDRLLPAPDHMERVQEFMKARLKELIRFANKAFFKMREPGMAKTALLRSNDYIAALTPKVVPDSAREFVELCGEVGLSAELANPFERIKKGLKAQVAAAKAEAETVLGRAVPGSKVVVFCIDRSWAPIVQPSIRAISEIFNETLEGFDQVGLYQLGDPWIFELIEKGVKEDELKAIIKAANTTGGSTALYRSMLTSLDAIQRNLAQAPGAEPWLIVLTDTVDIDDSTFEDDKNKMDPELKRRLQKAGARVGEVTFSLMWHTTDDLDLHVKTPDNSHIYYGDKKAGNSGGWLDVDMNVRHETTEPVENVFWDKCPAGKYSIEIENYSFGPTNKERKPIKYTLTLRTKVEVKIAAPGCSPEAVWGMKTFSGEIKNSKHKSRATYTLDVPKNGVEKPADTRIINSVCTSLESLSKSGLRLCLIDSRQISGWQPENPRWSEWRSNIDKMVQAVTVGGGEAFHLSAANEAEIFEKFGEIAEMMT